MTIAYNNGTATHSYQSNVNMGATGQQAARAIVRPQRIASKSVLDSVIDFIQDVFPQLYHQPVSKSDEREPVKWVRVETLDYCFITRSVNSYSNAAGYNSGESAGQPQSGQAVYIFLGYQNGMQIWYLDRHGEAQEVLSLRQGPVKCAKVLPHPEDGVFGAGDGFLNLRPLLAVCDNASSHPLGVLKFISLRTGEVVKQVKFNSPIHELMCNQRAICVTFHDRIVVLDPCTLKERFSIGGPFPKQDEDVANPAALGLRWLAYAERNFNEVYFTRGGVADSGTYSYTASVMSVANTISQGLSSFSEAVANSLGGTTPRRPSPKGHDSAGIDAGGGSGSQDSSEVGAVTIIDFFHAGEGELSLRRNNLRTDAVIAHFIAHQHSSVASLYFSADGNLLFTACQEGQQFHIFRIAPHPGGSSLANAQHLYVLYRGGTMSKVQEVTFSAENRWVAVCTYRGTCHLFPINPYGGLINAHTHLSNRVVNRISHFQKSAGLDEIDPNAQHLDDARTLSPTSQTSPNGSGTPTTFSNRPPSSNELCAPANSSASTKSSNSTAAPFLGDPRGAAVPLVVEPMAQIKHGNGLVPAAARAALPGSVGGSGGGIGGGGSGSARKSLHGSAAGDSVVSISAFFSSKRIKPLASPQLIDKKGITYVDGLYIMSSHGTLVEYLLHPYPTKLTVKKKIPEDAPVALGLEAYIQWQLSRVSNGVEFGPPLAEANPLIQIGRIQRERIASDDDAANSVNQTGKRDNILFVQPTQTSNNAGDSEAWLSQVEICTHQGPSRRLWMGPQFQFKTYRTSAAMMAPMSSSGASSAVLQQQTSAAMNVSELSLASLKINPVRSQPVMMPKRYGLRAQTNTAVGTGGALETAQNSIGDDASSLSSTEGLSSATRVRAGSSGGESSARGGGTDAQQNTTQQYGTRRSSGRDLADTIADAMMDAGCLLSPSDEPDGGGLPLDMMTRDDVVEEIQVPPHPTPPQSSSTMAAALASGGNELFDSSNNNNSSTNYFYQHQ